MHPTMMMLKTGGIGGIGAGTIGLGVGGFSRPNSSKSARRGSFNTIANSQKK